jgi:hypothetical protein
MANRQGTRMGIHPRPVDRIIQSLWIRHRPVRERSAERAPSRHVTRRACVWIGIAASVPTGHVTAPASDLPRRGATIIEVSHVLGHRNLGTTAIHAKVDLDPETGRAVLAESDALRPRGLAR